MAESLSGTRLKSPPDSLSPVPEIEALDGGNPITEGIGDKRRYREEEGAKHIQTARPRAA
jgi:hypothetical protein